MKLLIVSGSQRTGSQSAKVAKYLSSVATGYQEVSHLELCRHDLGHWDGDDNSLNELGSSWTMIKHKLRRADALILITPEWGDMATPLLKSFLLMCSADETAHKPAMLVSVVSGISGAYPIAELRMNALRNNKIVAVPDHLIVRNVNDVLNEEANLTQQDINLRNRIDYYLHMLYRYSEALMSVRQVHQSQSTDTLHQYRYGM